MKQPAGAVAALTDPASWVDRHGDFLFRYALRRVHQAELAEDLVQEAFLGALQSRDRFAGGSSERTWLVGILKHKIVDRLRRQYREQPVSTLADDGWGNDLFDQTGHWKNGPSQWAKPSAALENAEFGETMSRCLGKLPRALADAFSLREMTELPSAEVCRVLDVSPNHLGVMMHRARLRLWRCLDLHWFGGERGTP